MHDPSAGEDVFAAIERLETRLTVFDWPAEPRPELEAAVGHLATFEAGNAVPALLTADGSRHLAWRGRLTGGLTTLYERLAPFLVAAGLDALFADSRIEVFAPAAGPLVVLGERRRPGVLGRAEFERWLARIDRGEDVDTSFPSRPDHTPAPPAAAAPVPATPAPGAGALRDADATLTERYDPDGFLEEAWVSRQTLDWRTDFMAPGTSRISGELFEATLVWRVARWEWLDERGSDADVGRWVLRSQAAATAPEVAAMLPDSLGWWVQRATQEGIRICEALRDGGEPECLAAEQRLRSELQELSA